MRKILIILFAFIVALGVLAWVGWARKTSIAAQFLASHLGTDVTLQSLEIGDGSANLTQLVIKNPRGFRSPSAFTAGSIYIQTTLKQLRANPLTIERIEMNHLLITIEENRKGKTNWDFILEGSGNKKPTGRHWLIKKLVLHNLTVQVIKSDGSVKQYPTLKKMEFYNLSDETGFPVSEIEKAIFNEVMKNIFKNLDLQKILEPIVPGGKFLPPIRLF